jgi:hypothetical protein
LIGASAIGVPFARRAVATRCTTSPVRRCVSLIPMSILVTGLVAITYCLFTVRPSAVALIVTAPGLCAVTKPKRSTVATDGSELRQVAASPRRSLLSGLIPFTVWASVTPAYRRPGAGAISSRESDGQPTITGMDAVTAVPLPDAKDEATT